MNCGSIQALSTISGTQRKLKDGNLINLLPGKWTMIGDLSKDFLFFIAKKYRCIIRKGNSDNSLKLPPLPSVHLSVETPNELNNTALDEANKPKIAI